MTRDPRSDRLVDCDENLRSISEWWDELHASLVPSKRRTYAPTRSTEAQRAARSLEAQRERRYTEEAIRHGTPPIGESAAPGRLAVMQAKTAVVDELLPVYTAVQAIVGLPDLPLPMDRRRHGFPLFIGPLRVSALKPDQPDPRVPAACRALKHHAARMYDRHPDVWDQLERTARRLARMVRMAAGAEPMVRELDQPCPYCGGLTLVALPDEEPVPVVVCQANVGSSRVVCVCGREDCEGCRRGGRHVWPQPMWRHLGWIVQEEAPDASSA